MARISYKKNTVMHKEVLGHRFFNSKLRKPNYFFERQSMRLHCAIDFSNRLIYGEIFRIHSDVESIDFAFSGNPGYIRCFSLKYDNFRNFWKIRFDNAVDYS